ncbi:MarC family NAAT transporter [Aeromonas caviae]|uniref:MarC family NAAT transporter n=1 Tax=Aeromonas caviae TaxID=648 RepID=UPI002AB34900|nr:MarC family NAAT transporter [Aeromonas caviae]MDY7841416.1 MarC family NAAT transporter [Aeromonas caviae]
MFFQVVFLALLALLPMVNPPTTATLLLGLSKGMSREHIRRQINMAALYLFATLCVSFFIGSSILDLFGISIPGLRLAGGLIIAFIGFRMLFPSPNQSAGVEANQNIAFVPLTMPSMCGPGTMALVISGAALMSLISWGVLKLADPVCKILGATGIDAMTRIMGFLLVCMGMQFCINGVKEVAQDPVFHGQVMEQPAAALPTHAGSTALDHLAVPRQP